MKRKVLLVGLVLAMTLTMVLPATALAAKPPAPPIASGEIIGITAGDVLQAGNSDRWLVRDRDIVIDFGTGAFLEGYYFLTYHTNVTVDVENEILQAGNMQGFVRQLLGNDTETGEPILSDKVLNVRGAISPAVKWNEFLPDFEFDINPGGPPIFVDVNIYVIHVEGKWTAVKGGVGNGTFNGDIYVLIVEDDHDYPFLPYDLDGHVLAVVPNESPFFLESYIELYN
ncbi:MAG: hypothetical protein JSV77_02840, partial [Dehalococcoidales bacterium]